MSDEFHLSDEAVEAIAKRVVELLDGPSPLPRLLTAAEVADRLQVSSAWVRERADDLGGVRLAEGSRPRLRFPPEAVAEALALRSKGSVSNPAGSGSGALNPARRRPRGPSIVGQKVPILPAAERKSSVPSPPSPDRKAGRRRSNGPPQAPRIEPSTPAEPSPNRATRASGDGSPSERRRRT